MDLTEGIPSVSKLHPDVYALGILGACRKKDFPRFVIILSFNCCSFDFYFSKVFYILQAHLINEKFIKFTTEM